MKILDKIKANLWVLRSLLPTIYFNFHYLPFSQAVRLPVFLCKPKLIKCGGKVIINPLVGGIKTGMIKLGSFRVSLYPNSGIVFENSGTIIFKGSCCIGNNSYISVGETGHLIFGNGFSCTTSMKLASYNHIEFEDQVLIGWNCMFTDTDFHRLKSTDCSPSPKPYGTIKIGKGTWVASNCIVMKNTKVPARCVVASNSLLNKNYKCDECTVTVR